MRGRHFAIEEERYVSIEFLLQAIQPLVRAVPGLRFLHHEHDLVGFRVVREQIDHVDAVFGL
jgi:hypothetical protein